MVLQPSKTVSEEVLNKADPINPVLSVSGCRNLQFAFLLNQGNIWKAAGVPVALEPDPRVTPNNSGPLLS